MTRILHALAACLALPAVASAQTAIVPTNIHGCATMSVPTSSTQIIAANMTVGCGATMFPTGTIGSPLKVKVQGSSANPAIFCKGGGTCSTVGEYLAVGESVTSGIAFNVGNQPPTIIGVGGSATVYLEW